MNHSGISTGCATCHGGTYANVMKKPATHIVTSAACETCHKSTTSFAGAAFNHTGVAVGSCATCHGVTSKGNLRRIFPPLLHVIRATVPQDSCPQILRQNGMNNVTVYISQPTVGSVVLIHQPFMIDA